MRSAIALITFDRYCWPIITSIYHWGGTWHRLFCSSMKQNIWNYSRVRGFPRSIHPPRIPLITAVALVFMFPRARIFPFINSIFGGYFPQNGGGAGPKPLHARTIPIPGRTFRRGNSFSKIPIQNNRSSFVKVALKSYFMPHRISGNENESEWKGRTNERVKRMSA